jgi:uridine kinase
MLLIFLIGPPGAGKTSIARQLASNLSEVLKCSALHIEIDDLRHMVVKSRSESNENPAWLSLLRSIIKQAELDFEVIIVEGFFSCNSTVEQFISDYPRTKIFVIEAPLEVCLSRNRQRSNPLEILPDEEIKELYPDNYSAQWTRIKSVDPIPVLVSEMVRKLTASDKYE